MITVEELSAKVKEEFANSTLLKKWDSMRSQLSLDDPIWGGYTTTYEDEIAYFCWLCGCNLWVTQDYWDGSETFYISLPDTEEEYQENLREAKKWWDEVNAD